MSLKCASPNSMMWTSWPVMELSAFGMPKRRLSKSRRLRSCLGGPSKQVWWWAVPGRPEMSVESLSRQGFGYQLISETCSRCRLESMDASRAM